MCKSPSCPQLSLSVCSQPNGGGESSPLFEKSSVKLPDIHNGSGSPRKDGAGSNPPTFRGELNELYEKVKQLQNRHDRGSVHSDIGNTNAYSPPFRDYSTSQQRSHTHPGILPNNSYSHNHVPLYRRINSQPVLLLPIRAKEPKQPKKKKKLKRKQSQASIFDSSDRFDTLTNDYAEMDPNGVISHDEISAWPADDQEDSEIAQRIASFQLGSESDECTDGVHSPNSLDQDEEIYLEEDERISSSDDVPDKPWIEHNLVHESSEETDQSAVKNPAPEEPEACAEAVTLQLPKEVVSRDARGGEPLVEFDDLSNIKCNDEEEDDSTHDPNTTTNCDNGSSYNEAMNVRDTDCVALTDDVNGDENVKHTENVTHNCDGNGDVSNANGHNGNRDHVNDGNANDHNAYDDHYKGGSTVDNNADHDNTNSDNDNDGQVSNDGDSDHDGQSDSDRDEKSDHTKHLHGDAKDSDSFNDDTDTCRPSSQAEETEEKCPEWLDDINIQVYGDAQDPSSNTINDNRER